MTKEYTKAQDACNFQIGDEVRITRKATSYENGWNNLWVDSNMGKEVGKIHKILSIAKDWGIKLDDNNRFNYPYFVLEKVKQEPPIPKVLINIGSEQVEVSEIIANILRGENL